MRQRVEVALETSGLNRRSAGCLRQPRRGASASALRAATGNLPPRTARERGGSDAAQGSRCQPLPLWVARLKNSLSVERPIAGDFLRLSRGTSPHLRASGPAHPSGRELRHRGGRRDREAWQGLAAHVRHSCGYDLTRAPTCAPCGTTSGTATQSTQPNYTRVGAVAVSPTPPHRVAWLNATQGRPFMALATQGATPFKTAGSRKEPVAAPA